MSTAIKNAGPAITMRWLLRREFWEHKGSMFWAPAIVAALLVVLLGGALGYGLAHHGLPEHVWLGGQEVPREMLDGSVGNPAKEMLARIATNNYVAFTSPLFAILGIVSFFYCLGALYDERRDRSILFWKSLPVSDPMTVLSKVATAVLLAPAITIGLITVSSFVVLLVACAAVAANGVNLFPEVLSSSGLYLSPVYLLALVPVYAVWALPTVGWLLLVSAWARTKPFVWAVVVPLVGLMLVKWLSLALASLGGLDADVMHLAKGIVARLLGGLVPGIWFTFDGVPPPAGMHATGHGILLVDVVVQSWKSLASSDALGGAVVGIAMLFGAARLRRWRE